MTMKVLKIDSSARRDGSVSRSLTSRFVDRLSARVEIELTQRDVSTGLPFVDGDWVGANFTAADQRTLEQRQKLSVSDSLIDEVESADLLVLGMPIYNFGIPASLKAWVDQICRAGVTFKYTPDGPVGLLTGKRAVILVASGGTQMGSDIDFATPYIRQAMKFIGIEDVTFMAADSLSRDMDEKIESVHLAIDEWVDGLKIEAAA